MGTEIDNITEFEPIAGHVERRLTEAIAVAKQVASRPDNAAEKDPNTPRNCRNCRNLLFFFLHLLSPPPPLFSFPFPPSSRFESRTTHAQVLAANLTMLFNEAAVPGALRGRRQGRASRRWSSCSPTPFDRYGPARRPRCASAGPAGAAQPAGRRLGRRASAASPCHPDRAGEFREGMAMAIDYANGRWAAAAQHCLVGKVPARRRAASSARRTGGREPAPCRCRARGGRRIRLLIEPINTFDIPGFFLNAHRRGRSALIDEVGSASLRVQY